MNVQRNYHTNVFTDVYQNGILYVHQNVHSIVHLNFHLNSLLNIHVDIHDVYSNDNLIVHLFILINTMITSWG